MNILLLSTHLNTGGITSYLFTLTKELVKRGHNVHVATSGGNMSQAFESVGAKLKSYNILTKSELNPRIYFAIRPISKYMQENNIDLVHAHTRITQVMGALIKKRTGCAYLSTCHGYFKTRFGRKINPCWGDAVIAISSAVEKHLIEDFHVSSEQVALIESGIDLDAFKVIDTSFKLEQRVRLDLGWGPIVGNVARLSDVKGPDILIKAMKRIIVRIPKCKLLLVGEGKMEAQLRKQVDRLGLSEHVRFLSVINRTSEMLSIFDIFAMPSRQEGLGLSIMEAQASGLPVVASRVGGIPSLIEDGHTGILVKPGDSKALANAIVDLFSDRDRMKAIGDAGRESIEQNYSAVKMADNTEALYKQLIE